MYKDMHHMPVNMKQVFPRITTFLYHPVESWCVHIANIACGWRNTLITLIEHKWVSCSTKCGIWKHPEKPLGYILPDTLMILYTGYSGFYSRRKMEGKEVRFLFLQVIWDSWVDGYYSWWLLCHWTTWSDHIAMSRTWSHNQVLNLPRDVEEPSTTACYVPENVPLGCILPVCNSLQWDW